MSEPILLGSSQSSDPYEGALNALCDAAIAWSSPPASMEKLQALKAAAVAFTAADQWTPPKFLDGCQPHNGE